MLIDYWVVANTGTIVEGDVRLDDEIEFDDGTRVVLFAVESSRYPEGINYRLTYFDPATGEEILRYDNSQAPRHRAGVHHRHRGDDVTEVRFENLKAHVTRFRNEVTTIHANRR